MKKIIDFILKELNILFTDYESKTLHDSSFFIFIAYLILRVGGLFLLIFGVVFFVVSIIISFGSEKFETWAFFLTFGALGVSFLFKRISVLLFYKKDDQL